MVESIKELKKITHKPNAEINDPSSAIIFRRISIYFTFLFLHTSITANQVTMLGMIITIIASFLFSFSTYEASIIASFLLFLAYLFDWVDGEIARYRKSSSLNGAYLDDIGYYMMEILPFIGLSFGAYTIFNHIFVFILGFLAVFSITFVRLVNLMRYSFYFEYVLKKKVKYNKKKGIKERKSFLFKSIKKIVNILFQFRAILVIIFFTSLIGYSYLALFFYGIAFPFFLIINVIYQFHSGLDNFMNRLSK